MPKLFGFDKLLVPLRGDGSNSKARDCGIPFGATLLLSGPPGAGKTTFALSLARGMMKAAKKNEYIIYYVSSETGIRRLKQVFEAIGWFTPNVASRFRIDSEAPDADTFYSIVPEPEVDRPVPSPEELVNSIFSRIAASMSPSEAPREDRSIIVLVDSVTALLKGCRTESDERRQTHEILHRLRSMFGDNLALTILTAEQEQSASFERRASIEDYLAEIVFHLYLKPLPLGRRVRVLEIVKCQGINMILGEHTWQIVTNANYKILFRHSKLRAEIKRYGKIDRGSKKWGTVAIYPRSAIYLSPPLRPLSQERISTGTPGLDMILRADPEYWVSMGSARRKRAATDHLQHSSLQKGTVTLIAGPLGAGKTALCTQFLLHDADMRFDQAKHDNKPMPGPGLNQGVNLLVSFDQAALHAVGMAWERLIVDRYKEKDRKPYWPEEDLLKGRDNWVAVLDFTQSQFEFNRLISQVVRAVESLEPQRVVFDGLSEWLTLFDQADAAKMLEVLMSSMARAKSRPTIFMTYELSLVDNDLAPQALGVNADNIIVVRQIKIQDEIRKIIYVIKSSDSDNDKSVRELVYENYRWQVRPTLDSFTGLLHGEAKPAEVLLQFFQENKAERKFNRWLSGRLGQTSSLNLKPRDFSRAEISQVLEDTDSQTRFPPADLKLLSVDEWWLSKSFSAGGKQHPLLSLERLWEDEGELSLGSGWKDFWSFEIEKATPKVQPGSAKVEAVRRYAVPGYMDYGMFCVNAQLVLAALKNLKKHQDEPELVEALVQYCDSRKRVPREVLRAAWRGLVDVVPRLWVKEKGAWFDPNAKGTIVEFAKSLLVNLGDGGRQTYAFSFDMTTRETCSCMFFELAWAFGASERFLAEDPEKAVPHCVKAITFLQFLVLEGLMPERTTVRTSLQSIFSRHFYSTLQEVAELRRRQSKGDSVRYSEVIGLPFFPSTAASAEELVRDAEAGFDTIAQLLERNWGEDATLKLYRVRWTRELRLRPTRSLADRKSSLVELADGLERVLLDWQTKACPGKTADPNDILEISRWLVLKVRLLTGGTAGMVATLESFTADPLSAPEAQDLKTLPTGYGCTGSWMYGVHRATRSPSLAHDLLQELTSLEAAEQRARRGAGLSARKDFFELHGAEPVTGMEYFSWRDLLRFCGSRARRRDLVLPEHVSPAPLYRLIHERLLSCLSTASNWRSNYLKGGSSASKAAEASKDAAASAVEAIVEQCRRP